MKKSVTALTFCVLLSFNYSYGQTHSEDAENPYGVGTYKSGSIYWTTPEAGACTIRYRQAGETAWRQGLDLWYAARDGEYRGSIVGLQPDTEYEVELSTSSAQAQLTLRTRSDQFPIGKITVLPEGESNEPVVITESGTPDGYHLVTVPEGSKSVLNPIPRGHAYGREIPLYDYGIDIDADYVIVRGVEIRNAGIHGIIIRSGRRDIVIENNHIRFWGRIGGPWGAGNFRGNMDSAIYAERGAKNITIQRNLIMDPRGGSNDWATGHPAGPQGISFIESGGGHVIRYNDIISSEGHGFNDAIGGGNNGSEIGNIHRDSDIYGNIVRNVWDDALEIEGGNMNVRVWGNYLDKYFIAVATAATRRGPIYIFRNVFGESRTEHRDSWGGMLFKPGGGGTHARRYYFHNTALQPNGALSVLPEHHVHSNSVSRNNIFDVRGRLAPDREGEPGNDYDYDFFSGTTLGSAKQENGFRGGLSTWTSGGFTGGDYTAAGPNLYIPSAYMNREFYLRSTLQAGNRHMLEKNPLRDAGVILPGFNDDYKGDGPDLGAFEFGAPPLEFGRRAYLNYDEGWAPWEIY